MPAWNPNKLFPRLSIRAKLAVAFVLLPLIPLAIVAVATTRVTVNRLRTVARATLQREVSASRTEMERALRRVEQDVMFLEDAFLKGALLTGQAPSPAVIRAIDEFLDHTPFLFRIKVVTEEGVVLFERSPSLGKSDEGYYYALRGSILSPFQRLFLPVEIRASDAVAGGTRAVPAVAIIAPVFRPDGRYTGVVVGEAYAQTLFAGLELVAALLPNATTGLVDAEGRFLYHSERKRTWESLFGPDLGTELPSRILEGSLPKDPFQVSGFLASAEPIQLGGGQAPLTLFRAIAITEVDAPVREFLGWVAITGGVTVVMVLGLAMIAARQFTEPIYQLRHAAAQLAHGLGPVPLNIHTNDELEDFASDFDLMARTVVEHQRSLEQTVTERTQELEATHAEFSEVLSRSADAIMGLDADERIRVWNRGAERLFGYSAEEVVGQKPDAVLLPPGKDRAAEQRYIRRQLERTGALVNYQTRRYARDGRPIPVSLTVTVVDSAAGRRLGTSIIMRDISLQSTLEAHMRRSERLAAMSVMAAGLAHEINNPIAIIGNRLEIMEAELQDAGLEPLQADLRVLRNHTDRLAVLTRDLLRFARDPEDRQGPTNLATIVDRVAELTERTLAERNVRLETTAKGDATVFGSETGLETVFLNLLLNAADAMSDGGTVSARVEGLEDTVRLVVEDEGSGVPEELRERIFEPFFTTKGADRGTGLGLPLCRSVVERHGGRVWVESTSERGARFVVSLPRYEMENA